MKKITLLLLISISLFSCGNDTELKNEVKSLVELRVKSRELEKEQQNLLKKTGELINTPNSDLQKLIKDQKEIQDQSMILIKKIGEISEEYQKLDDRLQKKYNSKEDKGKFLIEYGNQLKEKGF